MMWQDDAERGLKKVQIGIAEDPPSPSWEGAAAERRPGEGHKFRQILRPSPCLSQRERVDLPQLQMLAKEQPRGFL